MLSAKRSHPAKPAAPTDLPALRAAVAVLTEVVTHLSERVEILEAREALGRRKAAKA